MILPCMHISAADPGKEPIIQFHTNLYDKNGDTNAFHISLGSTETTYVDIDCGFGSIEEEISPAVFDAETSSIKATVITCSVSSEGDVKIYGDPSKIDYIDFAGCYISNISFPELTGVRILNMEHNELEALDISHMHELEALYLSDNTFHKSPLVVGPAKPNLTIAELSIIDNMDPSFSLRDYPALASFEAWNNKGLIACDPTGCPELLRLSIDVTPVASLDVSKNTKLLILNIAETRIPSIDLSNNPYLTEFYCGHTGTVNNDVKLTELNLGKKESLVRLYCSDNLLTTLDISGCPALTSFSCAGNRLTSIDFTQCPALYSVDISRNLMDFVTIPADRPTFGEYYYSQKAFEVDRSYATGSVLDFSAKVNRPESVTQATLYMVDENNLMDPVMLDNTYYNYDNGKLTLLKECSDSVYVSFTNSALPLYPLTTKKFMVKSPENFGKPNAAVSFSLSSSVKDFSMTVGVGGATASSPVNFTVDFGDGNPVEYTATGNDLEHGTIVSGSRKGTGKVTVYMPEGYDITAFAIENTRMLSCDFSAARSLSLLTIRNCSLPRIDLTWNRCLSTLDLSGNSLTALDLSTENGDYGKNVLSKIYASKNRISSIEFNNHRTPIVIDLSNNQLSEIPLKDMSNLRELSIANNLLTDISLQDCEALQSLDVSGNALTSLYIPDYTPLRELNIKGNNITIPALPAKGELTTYLYAPQREIQLPTKAPSINLTSEWLEENGMTTVYKWFTTVGDTPLTDTQISGEKGRFTFLDANAGEVYCTISHPAFPDFDSDPIRTTPVETAEMPQHVFATFTTVEDGEATLTLTAAKEGTAVYVDWTGDGTLEQYILAESYIPFTVTTHAGTDVKCYSYDENDGLTVFSLTDARLSKIDASAMKGLIHFSCSNAGLKDGSFKLPASPLSEINMQGNELTAIDLSAYRSTLSTLSLNSNRFETFDLTPYQALTLAHIGSSGLKEVKMDNPALWELNLMGNELTSIDLSKVPAMEQLWLSNNNLTAIDVDGLTSLRALTIDGNRFTFATLPAIKDSYYLYVFVNQQPIAIDVVDGKVDLSSQAKVGDSATTYRWFIDSPYYDENDELTGEELIEGTEYTIDNGVTTFLKPFSHIMCVMNNDLFPNLNLYTDFIDVRLSAIDAISTDGNVAVHGGNSCITISACEYDVPCTVYGVNGMKMRHGATDADGNLRFDNLAAGIYIVNAGSHTVKVAVR